MKPGLVFSALLPGGGEVQVLVQSLEGECLVGKCLQNVSGINAVSVTPNAAGVIPVSPASPEGLPPLILFQALPKGTKLDLIVRQAAEGAVTEIVPFEAEYSVVRLKDGGYDQKTERWRRIIREARQQSGSAAATAIRSPQSFDSLLSYWEELKRMYPGARGIFLHQTRLAEGAFHRYLDPVPACVALAIGPEGGFSPGETEGFMAAGFKPLTLGHSILRTETAALYGMAAIRIILLENASWMQKIP